MKILISAYACEPNKGSEPEVGWSWVTAAAREHEVWVLTRSNNRDPIETAISAGTAPEATFVFLDLPPRWRRWKRHGRAVRLYYVVWQGLAGREARRLHAQERFDVVHHLTFANMWLPALACLAPAPFVLGPVAGGQRVPRSMYRTLGARAASTEVLLLMGRWLSAFNPLVRLGWRRASVILVNNEETGRALPQGARSRVLLRPNTCIDEMFATSAASNGSGSVARTDASSEQPVRVALCVGRLNRFKAVSLAIRAMTLAPGWRLLIVGKGPDEARLGRLARDLGVDHRVDFRGPVPRSQVWQLMATSDALLFPSLKEGAGFVVAEAASVGLPVVAFDLGGPAAFALFRPAARVDLVPVSDSYPGLAAGLARVARSPRCAPLHDLGVPELCQDLVNIYATAAGAAVLPEVAGVGVHRQSGVSPPCR